jgi:hypothetical protein
VAQKAVALAQQEKSTWTRADLVKHLGRVLPRTGIDPAAAAAQLEDLADRALQSEFEQVVRLEARVTRVAISRPFLPASYCAPKHRRSLSTCGNPATPVPGSEELWQCPGRIEPGKVDCGGLMENGTFTRLNPRLRPNSFWCGSDPANPSLGAVSGPRRPPRLTFVPAGYGSPASCYDMPGAGHSPITDIGLVAAAFGQHVVERAPHAGGRLDDCPEPEH